MKLSFVSPDGSVIGYNFIMMANGTGKTTTVNSIIRIFENRKLKVALAAPTGRAAKRMTELTGREAKTIHRLLEVEWDEDDKPVFRRDVKNPLDCNALILDELSMVDISLFASLLDALPLGCRLILVGDSDQLPPVGAGNVLHDLIKAEVLPVIELNKVFRQAMESKIISNAHRIVKGEMPDLKNDDKTMEVVVTVKLVKTPVTEEESSTRVILYFTASPKGTDEFDDYPPVVTTDVLDNIWPVSWNLLNVKDNFSFEDGFVVRISNLTPDLEELQHL